MLGVTLYTAAGAPGGSRLKHLSISNEKKKLFLVWRKRATIASTNRSSFFGGSSIASVVESLGCFLLSSHADGGSKSRDLVLGQGTASTSELSRPCDQKMSRREHRFLSDVSGGSG